jgi:hypothetical protein
VRGKACVPECPVEAIFHEGNVPSLWTDFVELKAVRVAELKLAGGKLTEKKEAKVGGGVWGTRARNADAIILFATFHRRVRRRAALPVAEGRRKDADIIAYLSVSSLIPPPSSLIPLLGHLQAIEAFEKKGEIPHRFQLRRF